MGVAFEEQVRVWAAQKYDLPLDGIAKVDMENVFDEGNPCCGGTDPGCYCSMATSASVYLNIRVWHVDGYEMHTDSIDMMFGDIGELVKEIIEAKP